MHKKIVYIDDDIEMIEIVKLILERKGYAFFGANGGQVGLSLIQDVKPDIILLDLMMPDVDGWEIYHQIKTDNYLKIIPVIILSAKSQEIDRLLGIQIAKVDDYLSKPFKPQELLNAISKLLNEN